MVKIFRARIDSPMDVNLRANHYLAPSLPTLPPSNPSATNLSAIASGRTEPQPTDEIYCCNGCNAHLCTSRDIVSRHFYGKNGRAFLTSCCYNNYFTGSEQKLLMTGLHIVRNVHCACCHRILGWTYDYAHEKPQMYKTNKYVIEEAHVEMMK